MGYLEKSSGIFNSENCRRAVVEVEWFYNFGAWVFQYDRLPHTLGGEGPDLGDHTIYHAALPVASAEPLLQVTRSNRTAITLAKLFGELIQINACLLSRRGPE